MKYILESPDSSNHPKELIPMKSEFKIPDNSIILKADATKLNINHTISQILQDCSASDLPEILAKKIVEGKKKKKCLENSVTSIDSTYQESSDSSDFKSLTESKTALDDISIFSGSRTPDGAADVDLEADSKLPNSRERKFSQDSGRPSSNFSKDSQKLDTGREKYTPSELSIDLLRKDLNLQCDTPRMDAMDMLKKDLDLNLPKVSPKHKLESTRITPEIPENFTFHSNSILSEFPTPSLLIARNSNSLKTSTPQVNSGTIKGYGYREYEEMPTMSTILSEETHLTSPGGVEGQFIKPQVSTR